MFVKLKKLVWKNVLSYGNQLTEFVFESGLNQISGLNGRGKSAIPDVLSFSLFGEPYRKIKILELINRTNKKDLYTEVVFDINNDEYKIVRTLIPNYVDVYKNNEKLEKLSSKKLTQDEIDKIIGINHTLFKQIISLAINYNKPFLSLHTQEKREIMESVFNIKVLGEMLKIVRQNNSGLKIQSEINSKTISLLENHLKSLKKQINSMTIAQKDFDKNKKEDLEKIEKQINDNKNEILKSQIIVDSNNEKIKEIGNIDNTQLLEEKNKISNNINLENYKIKKIKEDNELFINNDKCPTCSQIISADYKTKELDKNNFKIRESELALQYLIKMQEKNLNELEILNNKKETYNNLISEINRENDKIILIGKQIEILENNKQEIIKRELKFSLEKTEETFKEKANEYKEIFNNNIDILEKIKNYEIIIDVLSETGIKSYFFKKMIPLLNSKINSYISQFDLPIIIQFDEFMVEDISSIIGRNNKNLNYYSFSEGEKKRIDLAILLSFIDVTKNICNWNCNLLIMDEIFDTSIDDKGLETLLNDIKEMIKNNTDSLCIYLISHREVDMDIFKKIYECSKIGGFSKINIK